MDLRRPLLIFALYVVLLQLADVIADDECKFFLYMSRASVFSSSDTMRISSKLSGCGSFYSQLNDTLDFAMMGFRSSCYFLSPEGLPIM